MTPRPTVLPTAAFLAAAVLAVAAAPALAQTASPLVVKPAPPADTAVRLSVRPAPTPLREAAAGSAGLFVGVNEFSDPTGRVTDLRFAVDDAVSLAHLFALELRLIPAAGVTLCLSGEPVGERPLAELAALRAGGATVTAASGGRVLDGLAASCDAAQKAANAGADASAAVLVICVSSHGFTDERLTPYVMPSDGRRRYLARTALDLGTIEADAADSKASHRLLLIDACQERVGGTRSVRSAGATAMSAAFAAALARPTGQVKIASCREGEFSLETPAAGHGLFTAALLDSLRGGVIDGDGDGVIRLDEALAATETRLKTLVADYNAGVPEADRVEQTPAFYGAVTARQLPLAVAPTDDAALFAALAAKIGPAYHRSLHARVIAALAAGQADQRVRSEAERFAAGRSDALTFQAVAEAMLPPVPRTLTVAADGSGDVRTVGEALAAVADGGVVRVRPGVYREDGLTLDRPVTLEGVGPRAAVIIEAPGTDGLTLHAVAAGPAAAGPATDSEAEPDVAGIVVRGLTVATLAAPESKRAGVLVIGGRPRLENVAALSRSDACVSVRGSGVAPTLVDCLCQSGVANGLEVSDGATGVYERCMFRGNGKDGISVRGAGTAPAFADCDASDNAYRGLHILDGAGGDYDRCTFRRNGNSGVVLRDGGVAPVLVDCELTDNHEGGLAVRGGAGGVLRRCTFRGNRFPAVTVIGSGSSPTLADCDCEYRAESGLYVVDGAGGTYERCTFLGDAVPGVAVRGADSAPVLTGCTLTGVGEQMVWFFDGATAETTDCTLRPLSDVASPAMTAATGPQAGPQTGAPAGGPAAGGAPATVQVSPTPAALPQASPPGSTAASSMSPPTLGGAVTRTAQPSPQPPQAGTQQPYQQQPYQRPPFPQQPYPQQGYPQQNYPQQNYPQQRPGSGGQMPPSGGSRGANPLLTPEWESPSEFLRMMRNRRGG